MNKAPAYQMYAGDWLKSRSVRLMDDYQRGWYIQLLNEAWDGSPQCMLPRDDAILQRLAGVSEIVRQVLNQCSTAVQPDFNHGSTAVQPRFNQKWAEVRAMFTDEGDYCYNKRQMDELAKQRVYREKQSAKGEASAEKRKNDKIAVDSAKNQILTESTTVQPRLNHGATTVQPRCNRTPTGGQPEGNSSSSSSSSSPTTHITPSAGERDEIHLEDAKPPKAVAPDDDFHDWWYKIREFDGILAKRSVKSMSHRCWIALRKEFTPEEIVEWWHGVLDGMRDPEYWPGFQVRAKLENLRDWKDTHRKKDTGPTQAELEAMRDRFIAEEAEAAAKHESLLEKLRLQREAGAARSAARAAEREAKQAKAAEAAKE